MSFSILLSEDDFRSMEIPLRGELLKWYFERPKATGANPVDLHASETPDRTDTLGEIGETTLPEVTPREENGFKRVTFPEFLQAGFIKGGDEIWCRALKRDRRMGAPDFVKGGKVTENGSVEFQGRKFFKPSKLALAMVNSNKNPRPAPAVNGYDYLFVKSRDSLISIKKKREELMSDADLATPSGNGAYGEVLAKAEHLATIYSTPEKPRTARDILRLARTWADFRSPDQPCSMSEALDEFEIVLEYDCRKGMQSPPPETEGPIGAKPGS